MKILLKLLVVLSITIYFTSCSQDELIQVESELATEEISQEESGIPSLLLELNSTQRRDTTQQDTTQQSDCPAFDHAWKTYTDLHKNCAFSPEYCAYLLMFWELQVQIAAMQCGFNCPLCTEANFTWYENRIHQLANTGVHPSHISNLLLQLQMLKNACKEVCG